jgi:hypothetical protein
MIHQSQIIELSSLDLSYYSTITSISSERGIEKIILSDNGENKRPSSCAILDCTNFKVSDHLSIGETTTYETNRYASAIDFAVNSRKIAALFIHHGVNFCDIATHEIKEISMQNEANFGSLTNIALGEDDRLYGVTNFNRILLNSKNGWEYLSEIGISRREKIIDLVALNGSYALLIQKTGYCTIQRYDVKNNLKSETSLTVQPSVFCSDGDAIFYYAGHGNIGYLENGLSENIDLGNDMRSFKITSMAASKEKVAFMGHHVRSHLIENRIYVVNL